VWSDLKLENFLVFSDHGRLIIKMVRFAACLCAVWDSCDFCTVLLDSLCSMTLRSSLGEVASLTGLWHGVCAPLCFTQADFDSAVRVGEAMRACTPIYLPPELAQSKSDGSSNALSVAASTKRS
jgi:hypothetical protein